MLLLYLQQVRLVFSLVLAVAYLVRNSIIGRMIGSYYSINYIDFHRRYNKITLRV